ncbi:hypothetical protein AVEN_162069-1 [Araneus ventricosus]|uniref:Uncharacterized protein n=1 Tax=Araneus ventricosus TaxID=182803 RepID=A0A4Y2L3F7_ARAVE|nr:hypothetical protein AVEN_162069-1 [Araneus ventricosus]
MDKSGASLGQWRSEVKWRQGHNMIFSPPHVIIGGLAQGRYGPGFSLCKASPKHEVVNFNRDQMTRTTPESSPPLQTSTPGEEQLVPTDLTCTRPAYTAESGFEPGTVPEAETLPSSHRGFLQEWHGC